MTRDEIKDLYDNETNPAIKEIYGNHLKRIEGKMAACGGCNVQIEVEIIADTSMVEEPEEE